MATTALLLRGRPRLLQLLRGEPRPQLIAIQLRVSPRLQLLLHCCAVVRDVDYCSTDVRWTAITSYAVNRDHTQRGSPRFQLLLYCCAVDRDGNNS